MFSGFARRLRQRLVRWLFGPEWRAAVQAEAARVAEATLRHQEHVLAQRFERLQDQVARLAVLDAGFHQTGKLILIARIGPDPKCVVRIYDLPPCRSFAEYKHLADELQARYGVRHRLVDGPPGLWKVLV